MPQSQAHALPRYLMIGTVAIAVLLLIAVTSHFLIKNQLDNETRLAALEDEFMQKSHDRLISEVTGARGYINYVVAQAESVLKAQARSEVLKAHSIATVIYERESGSRPESEVKELIREALRGVRFFNGRGYLFMGDQDGVSILLPTSPAVEGHSLYDNQDDTGHYIMRGLLDAVKNPQGEGYSRYRWYAPHDQTKMEDKLAFAKLFEPYQWIIGTGDYLYQIENDLKAKALKRLGAIRFGEHGYFAVFNAQGHFVSTPGVSSIKGDVLSEEGQKLEQEVIAKIHAKAAEGGGFIEYDWYFPNGEGPYRKVSLVEKVEELGWIIVAGFYLDDIAKLLEGQKALLTKTQREDRFQLYAFLLLAAVLTLSLTMIFSQWMNRRFTEYHEDIEQKQSELYLKTEQLQLASRVFDNAREGIMVAAKDSRLLAVNDAFTEITGYTSDEVLGKNPKFLQSGRHDETFYRHMWAGIDNHGQWSGEIWNRRKNGDVFPQWLTISASLDEEGQVLNYIASITDLTERKEVEQKLQYLSDYDPLTSLPNRRLLGYRVDQTIIMSKQKGNRPFALLYIDLDHFKNINDSLGHRFGDEILQKVAKRIENMLPEGDTVSRLGGDEFMILISDLGPLETAATLSEKVLYEISKPLENDSHLTITPSIGIAVYPNDGENFDKLLRNADAAVHFAKKQGRNNYQFYTAEMNHMASQRLQVEIALRKAIENKEFVLFYQPQMSLQGKKVIGCEALIRWQHPTQGLVFPDFFITLAEESGLIVPIGAWVLKEACAQGVKWLEKAEGEFTMSVNVSVRQFRPELVDEVRNALVQSGLPPHALVVEITESTLMQNEETTLKLLRELKQLGVQLSLDDFGTGYSSMAYLKRFNLDQLKIDRAFIAGLPGSKDDATITSAIIDVASHFDLITVAEGIETIEQAEILADMGCVEGQGYLYEKPILPQDFEEKFLTS